MCEYCKWDEDKDIYPESFLHSEKPNLFGKVVYELDIEPNRKEVLITAQQIDERDGYLFYGDWAEIGKAAINYCPMCGRKL